MLVSIAQPDSIMRVYEALESGQFREIKSAQRKFLGDWNSLCTWKSAASGEQYLYLFGKKQAVMILVKDQKNVELVEVSDGSNVLLRSLLIMTRSNDSQSILNQSPVPSPRQVWYTSPTRMTVSCTAFKPKSQLAGPRSTKQSRSTALLVWQYTVIVSRHICLLARQISLRSSIKIFQTLA